MTRPVLASRNAVLRVAALLLSAAAGFAWAAASAATAATLADSVTAARVSADGFENVAVRSAPFTIEYENRRWSHTTVALGRLSRLGLPAELVERRLDLPAATVRLDSTGAPASVTYPFENAPAAADGPARLRTTRRSLDLLVGPLLQFELGRVYDASELRWDLRPQLVANPWSGGRLRASWIVPLSSDFEPGPLDPDSDRPRPGPVTLEQYAWWHGVGLVSGTAGLLGANRWGLSAGIARPIAQGALLLDAQADRTGFFAWERGGVVYSTPTLWTGHAGVTFHPPIALDLALRARASRYLYGDSGIEVELRRGMGDLELAFFSAWSEDARVSGVRLDLPVPPLTRPAGGPLRVLPVPRFRVEYRDEAAPFGVALEEVASRERFLGDLSLPELSAGAGRIAAARGAPPPRPTASDLEASFAGTTGFVVTPHWRVLPDRRLETGYGRLSAPGAWDHRGSSPNEVWYATIGYLPRTEIGLRWTVIPGVKSFEDLVPDSRLTDADRMLSARLALLEPAGWRPGVAVGVEDASGTRRFHSTYVVAGASGPIRSLRVGAAGGYAPRALTATRHVLDGGFGAVEVALPPHARILVEHDSEKWNAGFGCSILGHLKLRAAWMDLRHPAIGIGWSMPL